MTKINKKICLILDTFFILAFLTTQIPTAHSTEVSVQEKAISAIQTVAGIDNIKNEVQLSQYTLADPAILPDKGESLGNSIQETVQYNIKLSEKTSKLVLVYTNQTLTRMSFTHEGINPEALQLSPNTIEATKMLLQRLSIYSGGSYFQEMLSILSNVKQIENNTEIVKGNIKFDLTVDDFNSTEFVWRYTSGGVDYPKVVDIIFNKGNLSLITDSWCLTTIGSDNLKISREEAIQIAQQQAEKNATIVTFSDGETARYNLTGVLDAKLGSANRDAWTAYPFWKIELNTNNYRGVYMIQVGIWADTGIIDYCNPIGSYSDVGLHQSAHTTSTIPPDKPSQLDQYSLPTSAIIITAVTAVAIAAGLVAVAVKKRKRKNRAR